MTHESARGSGGDTYAPLPETATWISSAQTPSVTDDAHRRGAEGAFRDAATWTGRSLDGRYVLRKLIGHGSMAAVFEAEHAGLDRRVAVKVLPPQLAETHARQRFAHEAKMLSLLEHDNIVRVIDYVAGRADADFLVMEYLDGRTLKEARHDPAVHTWTWTRSAVLQILAALDAAHQRGIVHRDIKPSNCFCVDFDPRRPEPKIKLLDFGVSKRVLSTEFTTPGMVLGTVSYMAPEQGRGAEVDARADLYSVGVLLYEMLTGALPFAGSDFVDMAWRHRHCSPIPPRHANPEAAISPELEALVLFALQKDPEQRFQSAREFAEALSRIPDLRAESSTETAEVVSHPPCEPSPSSKPPSEDEHWDLRIALENLARSRLVQPSSPTSLACSSLRQRRTLQPSAVDSFWPHPVGGGPNLDHRVLPLRVRALDVFSAGDGRLLLLGAPGTGKSHRVLEIAADLHARSSRDPRLASPLPALVELSGWEATTTTLREWIVRRLHRDQRVPAARVRSWLDQRRIVPLLDGLDQVAVQHRLAAVQQINRFLLHDSPPGMVVTCVGDVYRALGERLQLSVAIELHELDLAHATESLASAGPGWAAFVDAISRHPPLAELIRIPLGFRVVAEIAQSADGLERLCASAASITGAYDVFVEQLLRRRTIEVPVRPMLAAVAALATDMCQFGATAFRREMLQPGWFTAAWRRWLYVAITRGLASLLIGLSFVMAIAQTPLDNGGLTTSFAFGWRFGLGTALGLFVAHSASAVTVCSRRSRLFVRSPWLRWGLTSAIASVVGTASVGAWDTRAPFMAFLVAMFGSAVFCVGRGTLEEDDVTLVDALRWSPQRTKRHLPAVCLVSLVLVSVAAFTENATAVVLIGLSSLGLGLAIATVRRATARVEQASSTSTPTIRNMEKRAVGAGALAMVGVGSLFAFSYGARYALWAALPIGMIIALWFGGINSLCHRVLCSLLKQERRYLRSAQLLDAATHIGLLEHRMGGFAFFHPSFSGYFASKVVDAPANLAPSVSNHLRPSTETVRQVSSLSNA